MGSVRIHACNYIDVILGNGDNIPGSDLRRVLGELIAAVLAAQTLNKLVLHEHLDDGFQVLLRQSLSLCDVAQCNIGFLTVLSYIYHYAQSVASLG